MNILELESSLPYGFHDADLRGIAIDYAKREATLKIGVWVAYEEGEPGEVGRAPLLRSARLTLEGLEYLIIEPPKARYEVEKRVLDISGRATDSGVALLPSDSGAVPYAFHVTNWNSSIRFAAVSVALRWEA